ncbi:hypothetical protein [Microbacterium sp.]|uniref:hypothetical protein n=1 Tax=Microbacterium sp. TaxID=51671 RepID=UPI003A94E2B3
MTTITPSSDFTSQPPDWSSISLDAAPTVILGNRRWNKQLEAKRLAVHKDAYGALCEAPSKTLELLVRMSPVAYSPAVHPEFGEEYLWITPGPTLSENDDAPGAGLVQIATDPSNLQILDSSEFAELSYSFYGVSFETAAGVITFIRKTNPRQSITRGSRFFKFNDVLKRVDQPDLVLDSDFDAVVMNGCVAALRSNATAVLMSDVGFSTQHVDHHVQELMDLASATIPLSPASAAAVQQVAKKKVSIARRLPYVIDRIREFSVTSGQFDELLQRHEVDPADFHGSGKDVIDLTFGNVEVFLDIVEGRYYEQDISGMKARADRFRPRNR